MPEGNILNILMNDLGVEYHDACIISHYFSADATSRLMAWRNAYETIMKIYALGLAAGS